MKVDAMRAQVIDGKAIGAKMRAEIAIEAGQLAEAAGSRKANVIN